MNHYDLVRDLYDSLLIQCDDSPIHQDVLKRARDYLIQDSPTDREIMQLWVQVCSRPDTFPDLPIGRPLFMSADWRPALIAFARALLAGEGRG